jgi:stage III sporulation protein AE
LCILALCVAFIDTISGEINFDKLFSLIKGTTKWILGGVFGIFTTILTIQNVIGKSADSVALKTAKFTTEAFIPVIGGTFSQSIELLTACSKYLRSAIGISGLIGVVLICLVPLCEIFSSFLIFKIIGAVIEPVAGKELGAIIDNTADIMSIIFAAAAGCALLFFMCIFVVSNLLGGAA